MRLSLLTPLLLATYATCSFVSGAPIPDTAVAANEARAVGFSDNFVNNFVYTNRIPGATMPKRIGKPKVARAEADLEKRIFGGLIKGAKKVFKKLTGGGASAAQTGAEVGASQVQARDLEVQARDLIEREAESELEKRIFGSILKGAKKVLKKITGGGSSAAQTGAEVGAGQLQARSLQQREAEAELERRIFGSILKGAKKAFKKLTGGSGGSSAAQTGAEVGAGQLQARELTSLQEREVEAALEKRLIPLLLESQLQTRSIQEAELEKRIFGGLIKGAKKVFKKLTGGGSSAAQTGAEVGAGQIQARDLTTLQEREVEAELEKRILPLLFAPLIAKGAAAVGAKVAAGKAVAAGATKGAGKAALTNAPTDKREVVEERDVMASFEPMLLAREVVEERDVALEIEA